METLWVCIVVTCIVLSLLAFTKGLDAIYVDEDKKAARVLFIIGGLLIAISVFGIFKGASIAEKHTTITIISTSALPQIDTTITYSVGKTDTVYTYHFMKED